MNRKILTVILSIIIVMGFNSSIYADEKCNNEKKWNIEPNYVLPKVGYEWKYETELIDDSVEVGKETLISVGNPARKKGETIFASTSVTMTISTSGSFSFGIDDMVAAELGLEIGGSSTLTNGATSAPLDKGEYARAYYQKVQAKYKVTQKQYKVIERLKPNGYDYYPPEKVYTGKKKIGYIYVPLQPKIIFKYFK